MSKRTQEATVNRHQVKAADPAVETSEAPSDFSKPHAVSDVEMVFPARVSSLMPSYEKCVKAQVDPKWHRLFTDWFYFGLKSFKVTCKPDIDEAAAIRHLNAVMRSFEPKHEHKNAACALLMSLWFEDATWEAQPRRS